MLFNSYIFIFIFFPMCITGFYLLAGRGADKAAKVWLIAFSLWFYGFFSPAYLIIMILSVTLNYVLAYMMALRDHSRAILITGVIFNLLLLGYFKYLDFVLSNINTFFKTDFPLKHILLPLGISFFTFQQIGYLADLYRHRLKADPFIDYALFVCFFPQLVAGPIVTRDEMLAQFDAVRGRRPEPERIGRGLTLFILGLAKKVLIADSLGRAVDTGYAQITSLGSLDSVLIMIWYALQLYFDFSGYCDMARGLAMMLGFELPVNFESPYKAANIVDFWHRWHMTLTRFFTSNVYIPLGGSRCGQVRTIINILIVYLLSGLWHGAGWNFVFWGLLHGVAYAVVRTYIKNRGDSGPQSLFMRFIGRIITFLYVSAAWVFFRASSIREGWTLVRNIVTPGAGGTHGVSYVLADAFAEIDELWYIVKFSGLPGINFPLAHNLVMIVFTVTALVIAFAAPNAHKIAARIRPKPVNAVAIGLLGLWCVLSLSEVSTFLYFNF